MKAGSLVMSVNVCARWVLSSRRDRVVVGVGVGVELWRESAGLLPSDSQMGWPT